jgi:hypothetical protein
VDVIISWMASNSGPRLLRQWYFHQANQPESTTIGKEDAWRICRDRAFLCYSIVHLICRQACPIRSE